MNWEGTATVALFDDRSLSLSDREVLAHWFEFLQHRQAEGRLPLPPDFRPCSTCPVNLSRRYWRAGLVPLEAVGLGPATTGEAEA